VAQPGPDERKVKSDLDRFEHGDVFHRVAQLRPTLPATDTACVDALADNLRLLLTVRADGALVAPDGPVVHAAPWLGAFQTAGRQLGAAAPSGELDRGLRAILAQTVIFPWNRLGLSAMSKGVLARAATAATLPSGPCP
jgi:thiopeptide-type bacteriocin biosynthesis protein